MFSRLAQGQQVVEEYNTDRREEERTTFVETTRTYNQEPNNDQLDQDNNNMKECKEQQQVEEEDELNAHNTIFLSPLPPLFPMQFLEPSNTLMKTSSIWQTSPTTRIEIPLFPFVVPCDREYPTEHKTPSISAGKRATD